MWRLPVSALHLADNLMSVGKVMNERLRHCPLLPRASHLRMQLAVRR